MKLKLAFTLFFIWAQTINLAAQDFRNLDFQKKCEASETGLCNWDLSWGAKKSVKVENLEGKNVLSITGKDENSVGFTEQEVLSTDTTRIQILSLSALVKSEGIIGKGAGLNIGLYDRQGNLLASKDMGGFYSVNWITGTSHWQRKEVAIVCPKETVKIKIGMILFGKGKVMFADLAVKSSSIDDRKPSKLAKRYLESACKIIAENSLVRDSIDITSLKEWAWKIAGPAKKYSDCFLAVNFLLESLRPYGDHHSFFMTAEELKNWKNEGSQVVKIEFPSYRVMDSCGYILVPPFHGGNQDLMTAYADSLQKGIEILSRSKIKGWIIDLRQNTGGNMEPMIAGLGPLFSSSKLGSLVDVNGKAQAWYYQNGRYYGDDYKGWSVSHPVQLKLDLPIAVLTSQQTGSSGEIVAISFLGNARTKSFGQPTWGLTTGNGSFELKDGSQIFLASTIMNDRNGHAFTGSIPPDVLLEDRADTDADEILEAAIGWIKENQK